jgi:hypothetical protein
MAPDPDWWHPTTDDYTATYDEAPRPTGPDDAEPDGEGEDDPTIGEEYAEEDADIRYKIERGRPGYARPDDEE